MSCASGEMVIKVNFSEPFRGVTYTDYDRSGPCKFYGDGRKYYELRIPLKGCGTKQVCIRFIAFKIIELLKTDTYYFKLLLLHLQNAHWHKLRMHKC